MSSLSKLTEAYLAGVQTLREAVAGMSRDQLLSRPVPGKWSTLEVVCHLADSDQIWAHRLKRAIAEDRPLLLGYDESRFVAALGYQDRDVEEELSLLEQTRGQMARVLRTLPPQALARTCVHNERGLVTLEEMLHIEIDHIPHHVKFIAAKRQALGSAG
jgi:uncharacterized damage-inducible protein DinB